MNTILSFRKILVANRGEIALRIMRTARRLGYRTVAVHSEADVQACHVDAADQAVCIGKALPSQSYLNIETILEAARKTGADAVHPGYGFLAENEEFAAACQEAGFVFIGPSPLAIRTMGDKAGAKRLMSKAGVPCIPGYQGEDQSEHRLASEAARIGYPVMIKATAGGGGRGMRLVNSDQKFLELLRSAQSEARNAFGSDAVILERAIVEPRHIEIQIFADRYGHVVHLGERDCSVQRRHQKVIEEAPSPAVDASLRESMGATAVNAVKAIGYEGAGTLEFLLDPKGNYYFMEMNTRLQVEHPVTEAITGLDLVEWQLRVAAGEPLPLEQREIKLSGHAVEARLCAEDVAAEFMPQSGTIRLWKAGANLRVEHALTSGGQISSYYDSMIAKLVGHGRTREEALRKLVAGLQDTVALGVRTNRDFLLRCLQHPTFVSGDATTAFISQHREELLTREAPQGQHEEALAAVMLVETLPGSRRREPGRRLTQNGPVQVRQRINGRNGTATLFDTGPARYRVQITDNWHDIEIVTLEDDYLRFICDGVRETAAWARDGNLLLLSLATQTLEILDTTREVAARSDKGTCGDGKLRATMNGRVIAVQVAVGHAVQAGQPLLTLEAMKMEHRHVAPVTGVVQAIHAVTGDQVVNGYVLVEINPDPSQP